jgi:perosamine synthetase
MGYKQPLIGLGPGTIPDFINRKSTMFDQIISFIRDLYPNQRKIVLHEPRFRGNEKTYVLETIESSFVSSVGAYVDKFETMIKDYCGAKAAVAVVNGTNALHMALMLSGVKTDTEVLTQALTFVATANAIKYCGADPVFIDSDRQSLGMSPDSLERFLSQETIVSDGGKCMNKTTHKRIVACLPMHVFGHPVKILEIKNICENHNITLVEDAAESLGSFVGKTHTGLVGHIGILSFNGNKTVTTGGGGMIITNDEALGKKAKHLTTTAKQPHPWEFFHDEIGYNYRMPNINAALGCAQLEQLKMFVEKKRDLAQKYKEFFNNIGISFVQEPKGCTSNYWLNAIVLTDRNERDSFIEYTNSNGIMTRPIWRLMTDLPMYNHCQRDDLKTARWLQDRVVNIPSSVPL